MLKSLLIPTFFVKNKYNLSLSIPSTINKNNAKLLLFLIILSSNKDLYEFS